MSAARRIGRRFPDYGWAWPTGELDKLLKAVLTPDDSPALEAALSWLEANDINQAGFREHRLLAALSERFGKRLASNASYPRLAGLQRMLWSKSRMALRDGREALDALVRAGISFMLIKGASRIALDADAQRSRISHDIDILVRPVDMGAAFGILLDRDWRAASGAGSLRLMSQASTYRAMNFFKGEFGDVDLHQMAYQPNHADDEDEEMLWRRSEAVSIDDIPARAPAASDRIALAVAHGAMDAHTHSDWLVDVDAAIRTGGVNWEDLLVTLRVRRILVPAASALTYLAYEIGSPIPQKALDALVRQADDQGFVRRLGLLECKPRIDFNLVTAAARGIAKQLRIRRGGKVLKVPPQPLWRARQARACRRTSRRRCATPRISRSGRSAPRSWKYRSGSTCRRPIGAWSWSSRQRPAIWSSCVTANSEAIPECGN
jgi:hypothetical protein